ncbi:XRE family transcriptional regulator [Sinomicrobium pectinilyticum]|uniref:XRE family transcriptional regulator n=1 Tax=Sinomicrobium pectinilyticum TaxID=1084421 RepID=A0A3N0E788_SINP1|nr:helix-turn-helix transcriptional regulator [Sinomicrobium pectinilyticum]RNL83714.1 XRE family transcriptional regulator [Sinomicrobium pectinilyticum]
MNENKRLRDVFKEYRLHYKLTQEVVEQLAKLKKNQYSRIESGKQTPTPQEIENIANVYGLHNFQIMNPKQRKPSIKKLPLETQKAILDIEKAGTKPKREHKKIDLGKEIDKLIDDGKLNNPITAKKLLEFLPVAVREDINNESMRITDLLCRSPRNKRVKIVDKPEGEQGAGNWYQLLECINTK